MLTRLPQIGLALCTALPLHLGATATLTAQSRAVSIPAIERYVLVPGASRASYAVDEVFLRENNRLFTAVGVTTAVTGEVIIDRAQPGNSRVPEIVVDLRPLTSDSDRRDRALREHYLDTHRFPHARLAGAQLLGTPPRMLDQQRFPLTLAGDLTVHGVTRRTEWRGQAAIVRDTLRGHAVAFIRMSEFDIEVPRLLSLRSADEVKLEIHFVAAKTARRNP